jgi:hypothetical protein
VTSVQVKDNTGATPLYTAISDGTNCAGETGLIVGGALVAAANGLPVTSATGASFAVTNAGTFAVQATQAGTWNVANTGTFAVQAAQATAANLNATVVGTGTFAVQAAQSGTWNIGNITGTVSLPTGAATSANQPTNATQGSTTSGQTGNLELGAVTTAAPTYTTAQTSALSLTTAGALRVDATGTTQPVSGTVTANQGTSPWVDNITQFGGTNIATSTGPGGAGIPRVTVSNDSTVGLVAGTATIGKVDILGNAGGILDAATGAAVPANAIQIGGRGSGNLTAPVVCDNWTPINNAGSSANLKIISNAASKQTYICSINLVAAAATNVALVEGTLTTNQCDTATAGMAGGATAATGWNLAANGGLTQGSGMGAIMRTATVSHDVCLFFSAANQVSGAVSWTQF